MASKNLVKLMLRTNGIFNLAHANLNAINRSSAAAAATKSNFYALRAVSTNYVWRNREKSAAEADATATNAASAAGGEQTVEYKKLAEEVAELTATIKTLTDQNAELMDKYKRALAESENIRIRLTKQIADAKIFGIQGFCKDLLEVADILGHATDAVPKEQITEENKHLKNLYEGLCMTKASLLQVFKRHGLEAVNPINEKFDPNMHEALFTKEDATVEPNVVVVVNKLGYKLHERCIRPALVGVSKS